MFESAARLGSLTKAADELCVTPTAVSKQLKNLESFLKTPLFIRSKQGVELTAEGRRYLERVSDVLFILAEETLYLEERAGRPVLNIEVGLCFLHFWLLPRLDQFRQEYPNILLDLSVNNDGGVSSGSKYDVAFFFSQVGRKKQSDYLLFHERIMLVCSPEFLAKRGGSLDIETILDQPLIMLKEELPLWEGWESWCTRVGLTYRVPDNTLKVDDQVAVIQAAINNAGIAIAWDWQVRALLKTGQLISVTETLDFPDKGYFLTISEESDNPAAHTFVDWVLEEEARDRAGQLF